MARFLIKYTDPETEQPVECVREFEDSHDPHFISAREWAEDFAYSASDKSRYWVTELKE